MQRIEKTEDEVLNERTNLIDEHTRKIEQLNFQIQEMIRTCIMEKQDLLKVSNLKLIVRKKLKLKRSFKAYSRRSFRFN
jgi:hypothetical protein